MSQPFPPQQNPYQAGQPTGPNFGQQAGAGYPGENQGDKTGGLIPYKNPKALIAYYCGIIGLLPLIGLPLSLVAFVLGILGLRARAKNPVIKGSVHAWIGIVLGFIATGYNLLIVFALFASVMARR